MTPAPSGPAPSDPAQHGALREVARVFATLGLVGFGGPAAHIAMMRDEVVRRRGWVDDQTFLDMVGACNLVPGPNSTELAIHLGHRRAGRWGLVVGGVCFILPAFTIVLGLAWAYARYGTTPQADDLRWGVLPVVVAVVVQALVVLARTAVKGPFTGVLTVVAAVAWLAGVGELVLLAAGAAAGTVGAAARRFRGPARAEVLAVVALAWPAKAAAGPRTDPGELVQLWWTFLKIGAVLYGSGYVLVAYLQRDVVERFAWLSEAQLLDAVAIGQFTPGPLFTTATFVGFQVAGVPGAVVATVAIFLPAFVFVGLLTRLVPWARRSWWASAALDAVNAVSLGLMGGVAVRLAGTAFPDAAAVAVGLVALGVLLRWRPNSAWVVAAGAAVGLARGLL